MPSIREQIIAALLICLETVPGATAKREAPLPETVPAAGGLIVLRDGDPGDPEVVLLPVTYLREHQTEIEVIPPARSGRRQCGRHRGQGPMVARCGRQRPDRHLRRGNRRPHEPPHRPR